MLLAVNLPLQFLSGPKPQFLQDAREFDAAAVDSGFYRAFGNLQHSLDFNVLEALQIAQDDGLAQFR